ncbi:MAG: TIGR01620 family protein [Rhizobiaceae bacterium]
MNEPRKPAAFRIDAEPAKAQTKTSGARQPMAKPAVEILEQADPFELELPPENLPVPYKQARSGWSAGSILTATLGLLVSLAMGLWLDGLVRDLFSRADWLGYAALGLVGVALAALLVVVAREMAGLSRLNAASSFRDKAITIAQTNDMTGARALVGDLDTLFAAVPETARGRAHLKETQGEIVDGADLLRLAETGLLGPLDAKARTMILDSAKRVSVVTAVSPRALIDVGYVIFESARLIRRLAELYGGKPGTLGMWKLSRRVIAHLAVTGSIAVGDSIIQQLVGHGLAAKLSARLGEGIINGLMTARVGIAAMDLVRPLPFIALKRPGIGDFVSELTKLPSAKSAEK